MNYTITEKIKEEIEKRFQINCEIESSKTSDYIKIPAKNAKTESIRISNHDAMTGRSACSLISFLISDFYAEKIDGKYETLIFFDDEYKMIDDLEEEKIFETEEEANDYIFNELIKSIFYDIDEKYYYLFDF